MVNDANDLKDIIEFSYPQRSRAIHDGLERGAIHSFHKNVLNVLPDTEDDRDYIYAPGLIDVKRRLDIPRIFDTSHESISPRTQKLRHKLIRQQGGEGSCTGHALAGVIDLVSFWREFSRLDNPTLGDIQDSKQFTNWWENRVSSRMLYEMARSLDLDPENRIPGSTIRNALKAFKRNGACTENIAPYEPNEPGWHLGIEHAKSARQTSLGTYCRLNRDIYSFHAAINEVGAVYVSAMIHPGWRSLVHTNNSLGAIPYETRFKLVGGHAFALIGYDEHGFYVLNSWGPNWGTTWCVDELRQIGIPGVAFWSYEDWQDNLLDAWVFRLGAPFMKAFRTQGGFGLNINAISNRKLSNTPRFIINGHYLQLNRDRFVTTGRYPNTRTTFEVTAKLLHDRLINPNPSASDKKYKKIVIAFMNGHVSLDSIADWVEAVVVRFKEEGVYPIFVFWNYVEIGLIEHLLSLSISELNNTSTANPFLINRKIERQLMNFGDLIWHRMYSEITKVTGPWGGKEDSNNTDIGDLPLYQALMPIIDVAIQHSEMQLHFAGYSDSAFLLNRFIKHLEKHIPDPNRVRFLETLNKENGHTDHFTHRPSLYTYDNFADRCKTIGLVAPLCRSEDLSALLALRERWNSSDRRIFLSTLSKNDESNDRIGDYQGSMPDLVQAVFYRNKDQTKNQHMVLGRYEAAKLHNNGEFKHEVCSEHGPASTRTHFGMLSNLGLLTQLLNRITSV